MNELDTLLRLGLIMALYQNDADVRARVKRLIPMVQPGIRPALAVIVLAKAPRAVIQRAIDKAVDTPLITS